MRFGGLFGVKPCPIRHYPREEANNEAQLWSLGVCITHSTVDTQSEQHEEEDSSPGRGQRERGNCLRVDDEDQPRSYRQKPSSLPQACSLLPHLSHQELTTATVCLPIPYLSQFACCCPTSLKGRLASQCGQCSDRLGLSLTAFLFLLRSPTS